MDVHIIIEENYKNNIWCKGIFDGLTLQCKNKKMTYIVENSLQFNAFENELIVVIGTGVGWIYTTVSYLQKNFNSHIILVSNRPYKISVSNVCTDNYTSMKEIMNYLTCCGKNKTAFYGVNPSSTSDNLRLTAFNDLTSVYYNRGNLKQCFEIFYNDLSKYDSVICANDYAAISLMQNLKNTDKNAIDNLFIVSFANDKVSQLYNPSITSVRINYADYGKAVLNLFSMLKRTPSISSVNVNIKSSIIVRDTTKNMPHISNPDVKENDLGEKYDFYDDVEVKSLVLLENILSQCDEVDMSIVNGIANSKSYEQIAEENTMSVNGVKYRIKVMCKNGKINNIREFMQVYKTYLQGE